MLVSIVSFSQIEIIENFDATTVPANWTSNGYSTTTAEACSVRSIYDNVAAGTSGDLTSPYQTAASNGTDLTISFDFNAFVFSFFDPPTAPPAAWGTFVIEYTTNNGTSWTNIDTIDDSNFTWTGSCQTQNYSIPGATLPTGTDFQVRFVGTNNSTTAIRIFLDNVSFAQVATTAPNCDATLTYPLDGETGVAELNPLITWSTASGLPTSYNLTVGTTPLGGEIYNNVNIGNQTELNLFGLAYSTTYYVNIVPENSIGIATGCTEQSFTTRDAPITGATCGDPIVIDPASLDYSTTAVSTEFFEDIYSASPCSSSFYIGGNEVVYSITPTQDISVNVELTNVLNRRSAVHVLDDCPDLATTCLAYGETSNNLDDVILNDIILSSGNTYYVVVASTSSTVHATFNLAVTQNSCIVPVATLTPIADCGNGQFTVDVDVTYMGSATSLTILDDYTTPSSMPATGTGIVSFGPYPSGTTVNYTITNDQDNSCEITDSAVYYCAPLNDECSGAFPLTVNLDDTCTNVLSSTNIAATESTIDDTTCGGTNNDDVWFSFVATNDTHTLQLLNKVAIAGTSTSMYYELLEGTCGGSLTSLQCILSPSSYATATGLTIGNTYYLRVYSSSTTSSQTFDVCVSTPPAAPANDTCSTALVLTESTDSSCSNALTGTTVSATSTPDDACIGDYNDVWYSFTPTTTGYYNIEMTNTGTSTTNTNISLYSGTCGSLVQESISCSVSTLVQPVTASETYYVVVRSDETNVGIDFSLCAYALPPAVANNDCINAAVMAESSDLNGNNKIVGNLDNAYYSPESCNSTTYETIWYSITPQYTGLYHFDFTRISGSGYYTVFDGNDCGTIGSYVPGISSCYNSVDKDVQLVAGNTYLISVHASAAAEFEIFAYPDSTLNLDDVSFTGFEFYPNPVTSTLNLRTNNTISTIEIYNIVGQKVRANTPNSELYTIDMSTLNSGVYFVKVNINNAQKTFRVIKN